MTAIQKDEWDRPRSLIDLISDSTCPSGSASPATDVVIDDNLQIFTCCNFCTAAVVSRMGLWVHIHNLAVPLVLEEQAS